MKIDKINEVINSNIKFNQKKTAIISNIITPNYMPVPDSLPVSLKNYFNKLKINWATHVEPKTESEINVKI